MKVTVIGLGPGDGRLLTREAWQRLTACRHLYLRTGRHPAVADLPAHVEIHTFDALYEDATSFDEVYDAIVETLLARAATGEDVVYAVPGHPLVGESTVTRLLAASDVPIDIVAGLSFVEPTLTAVVYDGLAGLQLFDAMDIAQYNQPPLNPDVPLLLGQLFSRTLASDVKLTLMAVYPDEHPVNLVHAAGSEEELVETMPLYAIDRHDHVDHLTSLFIPPRSNVASLSGLAETVATLRGPGGCPWDQEQTPQSMRPTFLEEAYEVLSALDDDDSEALAEELGDLLYHIVMQTVMAAETDAFTLTDVVAGIDAKLKRRHPHVYGDVVVRDSKEVVRNWEQLKEAEKGGLPEASLLDNMPEGLPALALAQKIQERVRRVGFDWPTIAAVEAKVREEWAEVAAAETPEERAAELGDFLFATVNWCRWFDVDAEVVLREANARFVRRFRHVELLARQRETTLTDLSLDALEALWREAKIQQSGEEAP